VFATALEPGLTTAASRSRTDGSAEQMAIQGKTMLPTAAAATSRACCHVTLADALGEEDPRLEHMLGMHAVASHRGELPPREQQILIMDFGGGMT
jgi:hypothetical protein